MNDSPIVRALIARAGGPPPEMQLMPGQHAMTAAELMGRAQPQAQPPPEMHPMTALMLGGGERYPGGTGPMPLRQRPMTGAELFGSSRGY